MEQEIMALCRSMGAGRDREELLLPLVRAAVGQLLRRLRGGLTPEDCGGVFPLAAAMLALDALECGGAVESFTAGEVSIRVGKPGARTERAWRLMAPWTGEAGFAFRGVAG